MTYTFLVVKCTISSVIYHLVTCCWVGKDTKQGMWNVVTVDILLIFHISTFFVSLIKVQCNLCYSSVDNCIPLKSWPCKIQSSFNIHAFVPLRKYFLSFLCYRTIIWFKVFIGLLVIKGHFLSFYFLLYRWSIFKQ